MGIPRRSALYLSIVRKRESAESDNAFASRLFLSSPLIFSVSTPIAEALRDNPYTCLVVSVLSDICNPTMQLIELFFRFPASSLNL